MHGLHLLYIASLAISSSADNVGVGIAFGIRGTNVPLASNLLIAAITGAGTLLSMLAGKTIASFLKPEAASLLGGLVIIATGVWVIVQEMRRPQGARSPKESAQTVGKATYQGTLLTRVHTLLDNPCAADRDHSGHIDLKESFLLGLALTLNNLVNGLAAGVMGLSPVLTTLFVVALSIPTIWLGIRAGCSLGSRWLGRLAGPLSGVLLILVGVCEIFL